MNTRSFPARSFQGFERSVFLDNGYSQFSNKHPRSSSSGCHPIFNKHNTYLKKKNDVSVTLFSGKKVSLLLTLAFVPCFTNPICALQINTYLKISYRKFTLRLLVLLHVELQQPDSKSRRFYSRQNLHQGSIYRNTQLL